MTAKDFLKQYKYAVLEAERCHEQYIETQEKIDSVRSALGSDGLPHSNEISRRTEDLVIALGEKAKAYLSKEEEAQLRKEEVEDMINSLPDEMPAVILYQRYIMLLKWEDVADALHYSLPAVFKLHGRGLLLVEEKLKEK